MMSVTGSGMNRIGIRAASLGGALHPERFSDLARLGFDALELNFNRPHCCLDWRDAEQSARIRDAARAHDIVLTAHAPDEIWITNPDASERQRAQAELVSLIEAAPTWGYATLAVHPCGGHKALPDTEAQKQALVQALAELTPLCEAHQVTLLLESSVPGTFTSDWPRLLTIAREAASARIGVLVDTNHLNLEYDLADGIRAAGPLVGEVHANDNRLARGWEEHRLPYDGDIDWPEVARALADITFNGPVIMEPDHFRAEAFPDLITAAAAHAKRLYAELAAARQ